MKLSGHSDALYPLKMSPWLQDFAVLSKAPALVNPLLLGCGSGFGSEGCHLDGQSHTCPWCRASVKPHVDVTRLRVYFHCGNAALIPHLASTIDKMLLGMLQPASC